MIGMRDKTRIKRILKKIEQIWNKHQDYRFYQLLINEGLIPDGFLWNVEDEDLEKWLDQSK